MSDPAYHHEHEKLADLCRDFVNAFDKEASHDMLQLLCGMITGQCAIIYKLAPPAGLLDIPSMFIREEDP